MIRRLLAILLVIGTSIFGLQVPAHASEITVTSADDSGPGSLREALANASDGDVITFSPAVVKISLTSGHLDVTHGVTIAGSRDSVITIERFGHAATNFSILAIAPPQNTTVTLDYLDIASGTDGGISITAARGTAINIKHSTIRHNQRAWGSGIYAVTGAGGPGSLVIDSSTIEHNETNHGNSCGACNGAGGIFEIPTTFINSTIAYNRSGDNGGGIKIDSNVSFYNTTIAFNSANGLGAGIWATHFNNNPEIKLINSIVAKNDVGSSSGAAQCNAADGGNSYVISENVNTLVEDGSCNFVRTTLNGNSSPARNFQSGDPLLGAFDLYGSVTQVFPLLPESPAIGAGDSDVCTGSTVNSVDQNGAIRGTVCSIGSVEGITPEVIEEKTVSQTVTKKISISFNSGQSGLTKAVRKTLKKFAHSVAHNQQVLVAASAGVKSGLSKKEVRSLAKARAETIVRYFQSLGLNRSQIRVKVHLVKIGVKPTTKIKTLPM